MTRFSSTELDTTVVHNATAVLRAAGKPQTAELLSRLQLQMELEPERWEIGGAQVDAFRGVLLAPVGDVLRLRQDAALRESIRSAIAAGFDTPMRMLRDLWVVLDERTVPHSGLEALATKHPYRDGPALDCVASGQLVRAAAHAYAMAANHEACAALLAHSHLAVERVTIGSAGQRASDRVIVTLSLDELVRVRNTPALWAQLVEAVRAVVETPHRAVTEVNIAADVRTVEGKLKSSAMRTAADLLCDLLASDGVGAAVISSDGSAVRMVVSCEGASALVIVGPDAATQSIATLPCIHVPQDAADLAQVARSIRDALKRDG